MERLGIFSNYVRILLFQFLRKQVVLCLTVGVLSVLPTGVMAQDILEIYQQAQQNDREYSAAKNQFEAIKQSQRQVKGLYYPTLDLSYEYLDTDQTINRSDNEVFGAGESNYPTNVLNLSLTQPLFRWDYRTERKKSNAEVRQGEFELIAAEQGLILRAAENYLLALAAKDTKVVAQAELDAVGEQLKLAEKRFDIGLANMGEVNESRARHQLNQAELIQAQDSVSDRMQALAVIVGNVPAALTPLKSEFAMAPPQPEDIESWVALAEQNNYTVQSSAAGVEVADAEYARHKADRYPDIDLFANLNNRDAEGSLFGGGSDVDTTDIGVRAQWTLFQGGRLRAKIREALFNKRQAEDELEVTRSNAKRETRNAYLGVVSGIARAQALKASLDAQGMTVRAKIKGFDTGTNSNLEVLDARRDFYFVQRDFLKSRYDYLLNMLNLKRLVGNLAPADLEQVNSILEGAPARLNEVSALDSGQIANQGASTTLQESPPIKVEPLESTASEKLDATEGESIEVDQVPGSAASELEPVDSGAENTSTEPADEKPSEAITVEKDGGNNRMNAAYAWLNSLPADSYTLQLATLSSLERCESLSSAYEAGTVHCFESSKLPGSWFALTGSFESKAVADEMKSSLNLPGALARYAPKILASRCDMSSLDKRYKRNCVESAMGGATEENSDDGTRAADVWLSSLPPESYTLQIATLSSLERCESLSSAYETGTVHCFESRKLAGSWFALTGAFESKADADEMKSRLNLPKALTRRAPKMAGAQDQRQQPQSKKVEVMAKE